MLPYLGVRASCGVKQHIYLCATALVARDVRRKVRIEGEWDTQYSNDSLQIRGGFFLALGVSGQSHRRARYLVLFLSHSP